MNEWIELLITHDEIEAQIIKDILDAEDIAVVIDSAKLRPYPVNIGKMGEIRLLVRKEDLEKAKDVLNTMEGLSNSL